MVKVRSRGRCGFCGLIDFLPHKCGQVARERKALRDDAIGRQRLRRQLHVLYRFFDSSNTLLYIGITNNIPHRLRSHSELQPWWEEVASATMEHYPDRDALEEAERSAIRTERPRHNKAYADRREIDSATTGLGS